MFKRYKKTLLVLAVAASSLGTMAFVDDFFEISKNLDIFSALYREVNTNYVDEVEPAKLMRTGIDAMLKSLDPYTNFYSESEIEDVRFMTTGQYGGIGATIAQRKGEIVVNEPYEGSPAQTAGLRAGDIIVAIDGKSTKGKNSGDVTTFLKGQPNTPVVLTLRRPGENADFQKTLTRQEIKIKNVPYFSMVTDNIGYIKLTGFTQNAGNEVKDALAELKKNGGLKAVILDLRGNPGGLLNEAVNVTNVFVDRGQLIVTTKGKVADNNRSYKTLNTPIDLAIPVAVLTNSQSASASEIVSGAIQDLDRGVVVGQRTFGKGLVQNTRPLAFNTQMKITVAKYYIPSGRCIQALDYTHRNPDGSVGKIPDSLIREFKTTNGRKVYDGGGVTPDFVTDQNSLSSIAISLLSKSLLFDYATNYRNKNATIAPAKTFTLSDADYNDFVKYLSDKDYDYVTASEKTLEEYKNAAIKEKYFDAIKPDYEKLKNSLKHDKQSDLVKFKDEISGLLESEIATRYYYQRGKIESTLKRDKDIKKAVEVLTNTNQYNTALAVKN
ncbi:S41 family peptidase [Solitalea canadensis]|uniref:C-terminal processing peptidase n=1 Tax=Solitalea canadensis (strain ATCC 29591 / DSM 3403 / JCM 21819 / LMG 8368 / NBRC 15130 / NCIMB 12057 / USAM 9D) TaxID=929556 RepID=H8KRN1_SOLCM|nr:S41 family peptidase [Solitalea canadensis]AFD07612.1 C-terminal processing peptidase [Solitalea canadensis DSM 3403]